MNVATRSRRARPESFSVKPGIAERLSLPARAAARVLAASAVVARSVVVRSQSQETPATTRTGKRSTLY